MKFIEGNLAKFTARCSQARTSTDPKGLKAEVSTTDETREMPLRSDQVGVYYFTIVVPLGPFVVTFKTASGAFNSTQHEGEAATIAPQSVEYAPPVVDKLKPVPSVTTLQDLAEATTPKRLDRVDARKRLMRAGIPFDDAWTDAKVQGALEGLDASERQRRAHRV